MVCQHILNACCSRRVCPFTLCVRSDPPITPTVLSIVIFQQHLSQAEHPISSHQTLCLMGRFMRESVRQEGSQKRIFFTISVIRLRGNSGNADAFALGAERQSKRACLRADPLSLLKQGICPVSCLSECEPYLQLVTLAQDRRLAWVLVSRPLLAGRCLL